MYFYKKPEKWGKAGAPATVVVGIKYMDFFLRL